MLMAAVFGIFGLIIGSFLNVLTLRWGTRTLTGRSQCMACGKVIVWYDLVPVLSWCALRGRCRSCKAPISIQYPIIELCTAVAFAAIGFSSLAFTFKIIALPITALLLAIAVYDFRHALIPDVWVYAVAGLALCVSLYAAAGGISEGNIVFILLSGPGVALPIGALWLVSRGTWMGFGDVKLALAMGWLLGFFEGLQALLLAFMLGAIVSVPLLFFSSAVWKRFTRTLTLAAQKREKMQGGTVSSSLGYIQTSSTFLLQRVMSKLVCGFTMKSEIPFGPFLIAATFFVWILNMYGIPISELWL